MGSKRGLCPQRLLYTRHLIGRLDRSGWIALLASALLVLDHRGGIGSSFEASQVLFENSSQPIRSTGPFASDSQ
ncbi:hypothetical protein EV12_2890 [Prochlorococcus sp. MIT 0701]|nr:hypothetical protein EV12_2890 [Prochlorococcus sp. MIT 0701]